MFSEKWLERQQTTRRSDPLLYDQIPMASERAIHAMLREGTFLGPQTHPLAEAILGTEKIIEYYERTGEFYAGLFVYRVLSLRDIATNLPNVIGAAERLPKLMGEQWQSALYELLVACSQVDLGTVTMLSDVGSEKPVPDICINDKFYVECKAKVQYGKDVADFNKKFQNLAVDKIFAEVLKFKLGFFIEIEVHRDAGITEIPKVIRTMITDGIKRRSSVNWKIRITPYSGEVVDLPHPMQSHSAEFWRFMMGFNGWNDWHLIKSFGEFKMQKVSNMMVTAVKRPILICARSVALKDSTQRIWDTVKNAASKQLREHRPGAVRIHVLSNLYGTGSNTDPKKIKVDLDALAIRALEKFSRLEEVRFDIVSPPHPGELRVNYTSAGAARVSKDGQITSTMDRRGIALI
ncbi:hypothetical protein JOE11_002350 [Robbsia andropogonis]|uniref:hypothetical protein n=1 Tax=Robbsia andropogonis TaxID=28092 RepID=UPI00209DC832|nr:hypothetical protein [Robbsia andropogonis]MCP1117701.1 hypothetical protein [Robbsia andropogonis]MCP1127167.1 hypothetical protein [Robbsia andropogonis]